MISRVAESVLAELLKKYPAVNITGPRQSGKTTLAKNLKGEYNYFSLENPDTRNFAEQDPRGFLNSAGKKFIIDEIQYVPALFSYLQEILDESEENGKVIMLGSQSFLMNEQISQSLAGRTANIKLLPLSLTEISSVSETENIDKLMFNGGYPRLYKENILPPDFFPYYMETYIQRDVRLLKNIGNLNTFTRFVKLCAGRIGSVLNISSLANDADISVNTAKSWLSILEASFVIYLLQPYHANINSRLVKSPKLYFYDTGLVCYLLNLEEEKQLESFYLRGNLFENFVLSELIKERFNKGRNANFYYFRDSKGVEIDCVYEKADKLKFAEIKLSQTLSSSHFKNIELVKKMLPNTKIESFLIYSGVQEAVFNEVKCLNWKNLAEY